MENFCSLFLCRIAKVLSTELIEAGFGIALFASCGDC